MMSKTCLCFLILTFLACGLGLSDSDFNSKFEQGVQVDEENEPLENGHELTINQTKVFQVKFRKPDWNLDACGTGEYPVTSPTDCQCAQPGYFANGVTLSACPSGQYTAAGTIHFKINMYIFKNIVNFKS